jgi:hypothetical protein
MQSQGDYMGYWGLCQYGGLHTGLSPDPLEQAGFRVSKSKDSDLVAAEIGGSWLQRK